MDKDDVVVIDKNVRTRAYDLFHRKRTTVKSRLNWRIFVQPNNVLDTDFRLSAKNFFYAETFIQIDLNYLLCLVYTLIASAPMRALLGTIFLMLTYNLPCLLLYLFCGKYTRYGFIKLWDFVPILKGVGYSTLFVILLKEVYLISISTLFMIMCYDIYIVGTDFTTCDFAMDTIYYSGCIALNASKRISYPAGVCNISYNPSLSVYVKIMYESRFNWWDGENHDIFSPKYDILFSLLIIYMIILLVIYQGYQRFMKYTTFLTNLFLVLVLCISVACFTMPNIKLYNNIWTSIPVNDFEPRVISSMIAFTLLSNLPAGSVVFGALSPKNLNVGAASVFIMFLKIIFTVYIVIWITIIMNTLTMEYQVQEFDRCTNSTNFVLIVAYVADAITRGMFGKQFVLVYYITLILYTMISTCYTLCGSVESLLQQLPSNLKRFRFLIFAIYIFMAFILNMAFIITGLMFHRSLSMLYIMAFFALGTLLGCIAIVFIYPLSRLQDDYHFLYGRRPMEFWNSLWRMCPLIIMFCGVVICIRIKDMVYPDDMSVTTRHSLRVICAAFYVPLIGNMLWIIFRYFHSHKTKPVITPESTWGPCNAKLKILRQNFFPERDLKYLSYVPRCKHKCLIGSEAYLREVKDQLRKFKGFINDLKEKHDIQ